MYKVTYLPVVLAEDIPRLDKTVRANVLRAIEEKLFRSPDLFGKPLRHALRNCRSLRAGDYRIVFRIEKETVIVLVIAITHRGDGYERAERRVK